MILYSGLLFLGHPSRMFITACCLVVGLWLGSGLGLPLVSGWLAVMHTYDLYYLPLLSFPLAIRSFVIVNKEQHVLRLQYCRRFDTAFRTSRRCWPTIRCRTSWPSARKPARCECILYTAVHCYCATPYSSECGRRNRTPANCWCGCRTRPCPDKKNGPTTKRVGVTSSPGASVPRLPWHNLPPLLSLSLPPVLSSPFLTIDRGYHPREIFGIKDAFGWVLEHFRHKHQLNFASTNVLIFVPEDFRDACRPGCRWTLVFITTSRLLLVIICRR